MPEGNRYWFPAKRHGWGWGLPQTREGRLVMLAFVALLVAGAAILLPRLGVAWFLAWAAALCVALVLVCWRKGEPPRWRWSGDARRK
ncbi:MAG TPA: hypothetical protein VHA15_08935 [Burkholderiales bacterium]|jgi:hypothetical protein|nr:hypothetical protein [Burkholderiales bacterium]